MLTSCRSHASKLSKPWHPQLWNWRERGKAKYGRRVLNDKFHTTVQDKIIQASFQNAVRNESEGEQFPKAVRVESKKKWTWREGETTYGQIVFSDKLSNSKSGQNCTSSFQKQSEMHSKKKIFKEQSGLSVKRKLWKWREGGSEMLKSSFKEKITSNRPGRTCNTYFQKKHPGWNVNIFFQKSLRDENE